MLFQFLIRKEFLLPYNPPKVRNRLAQRLAGPSILSARSGRRFAVDHKPWLARALQR